MGAALSNRHFVIRLMEERRNPQLGLTLAMWLQALRHVRTPVATRCCACALLINICLSRICFSFCYPNAFQSCLGAESVGRLASWLVISQSIG